MKKHFWSVVKLYFRLHAQPECQTLNWLFCCCCSYYRLRQISKWMHTDCYQKINDKNTADCVPSSNEGSKEIEKNQNRGSCFWFGSTVNQAQIRWIWAGLAVLKRHNSDFSNFPGKEIIPQKWKSLRSLFPHCKVENILKVSLDWIPSPSLSVKIQIISRKVCLRNKGKHYWSLWTKFWKQKVC